MGLLILEVERKLFPSPFISYMVGERQGWHAMEILHLNNWWLFGTKSFQISPTGVSQILPQHSQALPTVWQQLLGFGEHCSDLLPQFHCLKDTFCCVQPSVRNEVIRWIQNPWWTSLESPEFPTLDQISQHSLGRCWLLNSLCSHTRNWDHKLHFTGTWPYFPM